MLALRTPLRSTLLVAASALALVATAIGQEPRPAGAKPPVLARYVPGKDLALYLEFDGLDAHEAAWHGSSTYKLLNETKLGAMLEELATQFIDQVLASAPIADKPKGAEILGLLKATAEGGLALGVARTNPERPTLVLVLRGGAKNGVRAMGDRLVKLTPTPDRFKAHVRGTRTLTTFDDGEDTATWWSEGDDFILTSPPMANAEAVIAVLEGKEPNAATNPIRAELARPSAGFEPAMLAFTDFAKVQLPPGAAAAGLDGLKRIDYRWGFQGPALYSVLRVVAPAPRRGVLGLLDGETFDKGSLPPIPAGLSSWTVFSIRPLDLYIRLIRMIEMNDPRAGRNHEQMEAGIGQALGINLKDDVLAPLGPKMVFYADVDAKDPTQLPRAALTAELRNHDAFAATLDKVVGFVDAQIKAAAANNPAGARGPAELRKVEGPRRGYSLALPAGSLPPALAEGIVPTLLVGKGRLALGLNPEEAKKALDADARGDARWSPTDEYKSPFAEIPGNLVLLNVSDPRATLPTLVVSTPALIAAANARLGQMAGRGAPVISMQVDPAKVPTADEIRARLFPGFNAVSVDANGITLTSREAVQTLNSPAMTGVGVALLLPAVQASREAARRSQCVNNLKQIGLAMHNYHDTHNAFPAAAITDKDGKPLLSWRVAILPFIEQQELYNEFHLDEPWDSAHNKPLIAKMPANYTCPTLPNPEPGKTTYRAFVGGGALFDIKDPVGLAAVTDGTSNTLMVVEAKDPVIWTRPVDLPFDPEAQPSLYGAGSTHPGGFNALMADGSVRFFKLTISVETFKALITRAAGEVVQIP